MPTTIKFRRGTTAQNNSFTGGSGEITVDTTLDTLRVHDSSTAGGHELLNTSSTQTFSNKTVGSHLLPSADSTYDLGDSNTKWRALYVSGSTIHLGGIQLQADGNQLKVSDSAGADTKVSIAQNTTDELTEGSTNLYHTTARVRSAISAQGDLSYDSSTGVLQFDVESVYTKANFDSDLGDANTGQLPEGSNLYYTTARADSDAKNAVSAVDAGGDGSFSYSSSTGEFTYTGPSATEVRSHFSAQGDLSYDSATGVFQFDVEQVYTKANFDSDLGDANTGQLPEGSNLYYTDERVDDRVNALFTDGEGITSTYDDTAGTLTVAAEDATDTNKGIASFSSDNFAVSSGAVTIKDGGVVTAEIADDAVTGAKVAADAIDSDHIKDNAINSEHYTDGSIDTVHIGDLQVTTAKIANDAIDGTKIADDAINSEHYVDGSIDTAHIADLQVTTAKIANDAIDGTKIADDAINSEHYTDGSIDTAHIGDDQVTQAKIADDAVGADQLASDAVVDASVAAGANIAVSKTALTAGTGITLTTNQLDIDAAQTGITSLLATDIKIGEDDQTKIDFETANEIHFYGDNVNLISLTNANTGDAVLTVPTADKNFTIKGIDSATTITALDIDMALAGKATFNGDVVIGGGLTVSGTTTTVSSTNTTIADHLLELSSGLTGSNTNDIGILMERGSTGNNAFMGFDESEDKFTVGTTTATADATGNLTITTGTLVANIEGNVTGNINGDLTGTLQTAAQPNVTSLGTLTTLTVDNIIINGTTIGHTSVTDAITIASNGNVTASQNLTVTGDLTVSGDDITMGTNTSGHIMVADGTNFNPVAVSGDVTIASTGAVTIANGAVEHVMVAADAIDSDNIADNAINSEHYTDGSIDRVHLAADIIDGTKIADDVINSEHYVAGSIDAEHIASNAVTTAKILDANVTNTKLATDAVSTAKIADGSVTTAKIAADAVTSAKIADDQINSEHYVDGSIDTAHIADDQVTYAKIQNVATANRLLGSTSAGGIVSELQVQQAMIADNQVDIGQLAHRTANHVLKYDGSGVPTSGTVDTANITADAITGAKIADDTINSEHYAAGSIDREHLAADIIDGTKIADDVINSEHYVAGSIDNEHLADNSVTQAKLADDAVGSAELKSLSTLLIKNSAGTTLKTVHGAGA